MGWLLQGLFNFLVETQERVAQRLGATWVPARRGGVRSGALPGIPDFRFFSGTSQRRLIGPEASNLFGMTSAAAAFFLLYRFCRMCKELK